MKRFIDIFKSVLAGLIGVQTEKNRKNDFEKRKPYEMIIGGLIMVIFLLSLNAFIVSVILST